MSAPDPPRPAWRGGALLAFALGGMAAIVALALGSPAALFLAFPLLVAPLAALLATPSPSTRLDMAGEVTWEGGQGKLDLVLTPTPPVAGGDLEVVVSPPETLTGGGPWVQRASLSGARPVRLTVPFPVGGPIFDVLPTPRALWRDPLGLVQVEVPVQGTEVPLERYPPEVHRLSRLRMERTTLLPGDLRSRVRSASGQFEGVRPYELGDSYRQVNWPATARAGAIMVNDFRSEKSGEMVLVVDARPGDGADALFGMSRAAALGLARQLLREKTRVGLVIYGEFASTLPLGTGRLHQHRMETALREARISEVAGPTERLAVSLRRSFPGRATVLVISPLADDDSLDVGHHLRHRGFLPVILSPSPLGLPTALARRDDPNDRLALRVLRLTRRGRMARAWSGAPTVDWEDFTSLAPLVATLRRPTSNRSRG